MVLNPRLSTTMYLRRVTPPLSVDGFQASDTLLAVVPVTRRSVGVVGAEPRPASAAAGAMNATVATNTTAASGRRAAREKSPLVPLGPPSTMTNHPLLRSAGRIGSQIQVAVRRQPSERSIPASRSGVCRTGRAMPGGGPNAAQSPAATTGRTTPPLRYGEATVGLGRARISRRVTRRAASWIAGSSRHRGPSCGGRACSRERAD
jgi:hypothetical protein